jgi:NADPH-dependent curcumin reductase CurA
MIRDNLSVHLIARPHGEPNLENFSFVKSACPPVPPGGLIYETMFLSVDPYLRGRMNDVKSYVPPFQLGAPIESGFVGKVLESENEKFKSGDLVFGMGPWSHFTATDGKNLSRLPPEFPPSHWLGVLGMPGLTAFVGLFDIGQAKRDETVVVSAAAGAVGSLVVQLAKQTGCKVVGIAGGKAKCDYVKNDLRADFVIDYKNENVLKSLVERVPDGVDVYFDNVGGEILSAVLSHLKDHARISLCGMISEYNAKEPPPGPNLRPLLSKKASIRGFIVSEHWERRAAFVAEVAPRVMAGEITCREDVINGLENAPAALFRVLSGKNFGKQIVKVDAL